MRAGAHEGLSAFFKRLVLIRFFRTGLLNSSPLMFRILILLAVVNIIYILSNYFASHFFILVIFYTKSGSLRQSIKSKLSTAA